MYEIVGAPTPKNAKKGWGSGAHDTHGSSFIMDATDAKQRTKGCHYLTDRIMCVKIRFTKIRTIMGATAKSADREGGAHTPGDISRS